MSQGYDIDVEVEECTQQETSCSGGLDEDCDGDIDCADSECAGTPGCATPAVVRINEVNANIAGGCDLIELRVISSGNMMNFRFKENIGGPNEFSFLFPSFAVQTDDFIVVHLNAGSATCNPNGATHETMAKTEQPAATFAGNYDTAYDFWNPDDGVITGDVVLTLFADIVVVDAVFISHDPAGTTIAPTTGLAASVVGLANQWQPAFHMYPGSVFRTTAVDDLDATGTTPAGTSIQRLGDADDHDKLDWTTGVGAPSTWGALNPGQTLL